MLEVLAFLALEIFFFYVFCSLVKDDPSWERYQRQKSLVCSCCGLDEEHFGAFGKCGHSFCDVCIELEHHTKCDSCNEKLWWDGDKKDEWIPDY